MEVITAIGAIAAIVFPIILFVALMMVWKDVREVLDILDSEGIIYDDEEYDDEDDDEDEDDAEAEDEDEEADDEYAPGEHMEDGVMDLERD